MQKIFEGQQVEETEYSPAPYVYCMLSNCCFVQPYAKLAIDLSFQQFLLMTMHCSEMDMASHLVCKLNKA